MDADKNTLMSGSTNVVILFITNIPGDLHNVDKGQLELNDFWIILAKI